MKYFLPGSAKGRGLKLSITRFSAGPPRPLPPTLQRNEEVAEERRIWDWFSTPPSLSLLFPIPILSPAAAVSPTETGKREGGGVGDWGIRSPTMPCIWGKLWAGAAVLAHASLLLLLLPSKWSWVLWGFGHCFLQLCKVSVFLLTHWRKGALEAPATPLEEWWVGWVSKGEE